MNTASKTVFLFVILAMIGVGVFFLLDHGPAVALPPERTTTQESPTEEVKPQIQTSETAVERRQPVDTERAAVPVASSGANLPQGVKGVVLDPANQPVADAEVFLMEGQGTNIFELLSKVQRGVVYPPLARSKTDASGRFALGLEQTDNGKAYDVRVLSPRFADEKVSGLHVAPAQWVDVTVNVKAGVTVYGHVSVANSGGLPIAGAEVAVKSSGNLPDLTPTPGRESGIVTKTDASGAFRLENVPAGIASISAVAPQYARVDRQAVNIDPNADNQINFELPQGMSIAGTVIDASGTPLANATVTAVAISSKQPMQAEVRSDRSGTFEVIGLVEGPYQLSAVAQNFVKGGANGPVQAGTREVQIVLEKQGGARLRVFGKDGRLLTRYDVTLKKFFKDQDQYGNTDQPVMHVSNPKDGVATMEGLNPDEYVFQVEAPAHAKGFSSQFTVTLSGEPPLVEVKLDEGGVIEGRVLDFQGAPIQGVIVETLPNSFDDNPFTAMFAGLIPFKITRTSMQTDGQGKYRFKLLNPGPYQLKFAHSEYTEVFLKGNEVAAGQVTTVPDLRMTPGAVLSGTVRIDGASTGQVKVSVSTLQDLMQKDGQGLPIQPMQGPPSTLFNCEAITDGEGRFVMTKRLPPGRYEVRAMRTSMPSSLGPLGAIVDMQKSRQEFMIAAGQTQHVINITFTSN